MSRLAALLTLGYSVFAFYMLYDAKRDGCAGLSGISAAIGVLPASPIFSMFSGDSNICDLSTWIPMYLASAVIVYGAGSLLERSGRWLAGNFAQR